MLKSTGNFFLFAEVTVIFKDVVNSIDFPHVAVCPLHIELFGLEQCNHILLLCFDGERGVTRVHPAWMCWPLKFGFLRVLNTTFQNVFLSLITGISISEFF